jgi:hypothetical protein
MSEGALPVDAGAIMLFARAVGDDNPIYRDPDYAAGTEVGSVIAPPTFAESILHFDPESTLRPHIGEPWRGSGRNPTGTPGAGPSGPLRLHAEQHYTYHQPARAGQTLTWSRREGSKWEKTNRAGRTLKFSERLTEFRDASGELVITARSVVVELPEATA